MKPIRFLKLLCLVFIGFAPALPAVEFRALSWDHAIANVTYPGRSAGAPLSISAAALSPWQKITPSADGIEFKNPAPARPA